MPRVTRHFVDVPNADGSLRRVHYRKCGSGPPLLLVHQSPRSGAEYLELMQDWGRRATCIAPDTPGFGDSDPLPHASPECGDYADALLALLDALGLADVAAYGFHSGAIILVTAAKRAPHRFRAVAAGGYAVWSAEERADFGANYTPPFLPQPYGEHLTWLWGRILEQSWFFPWYRAEPGARLPNPTDDPAAVHPIVMEVLAAGDSFRHGYAAVLRANRDIPAAGAPTPPTLVVAYRADPLHAHLARLGELPPNWRALGVESPAEALAAAEAWLRPHLGPEQTLRGESGGEGFVQVRTVRFDGLVHWRGEGEALRLHAPGSALTAFDDGLRLDLPGHGLSDDWREEPTRLGDWVEVVAAALTALGATPARVEGLGWSSRLAAAVADRLGLPHAGAADPAGDPGEWRARGLPELAPDRYGAYLHRAWQQVRAETFFTPWFAPSAASARAFAREETAPELLATRHLALLRARAGRALLHACIDGED